MSSLLPSFWSPAPPTVKCSLHEETAAAEWRHPLHVRRASPHGSLRPLCKQLSTECFYHNVEGGFQMFWGGFFQSLQTELFLTLCFYARKPETTQRVGSPSAHRSVSPYRVIRGSAYPRPGRSSADLVERSSEWALPFSLSPGAQQGSAFLQDFGGARVIISPRPPEYSMRNQLESVLSS